MKTKRVITACPMTSVAESMNLALRAMVIAAWLCAAGILPAQAQTWSSPHLGGYLTVNYTGVANTYNAGYSMYVAQLGRPQYAYYSPNFQASFQIGTWMTPQCAPGVYCDIEGGPGVGGGYGNHWCNHGFGIGAVAGNGFTNYANGVSSGNGVGVYGAAQISPRLLYPPRLEMFRNGSKGQLVGYGYLALPLLPGKPTTDGVDVPTGDRWWTLFFNTRNFQGPVAVLTPHFYSEVTKANPGAAGKMLDSCWAGPNKSIANESHNVPGREYDGPEGSFLRVAPVFSAINDGTNGSIALNSPTAYDQTALWNAAQQWFTNSGPAPLGPFNARGAALQTPAGGSFGWGIYDSPLGSVPLVTGSTMGFYNADSATWGFKWGTNQVTYTQFADGTPAAVMPEFYQLQAGKWTPVSSAAVPSQLASVTFDSGSPPAIPETYTVPSDPVWTNPGPAAGPFQARIEDGDVVTYYWFRFADQPAIMKAGLTPAEREQLQANVVKIHSAWTNGGTYLAPPTMGTLADVDPALLVTPPPGLEVGYVPVASNQFWGGWVTPTWNQAASGNWSGAGNWVSASAPESGGHSYYRLTFSPPGSCVATNDLGNGYGYGGFAANQLNFSGAVTLAGNPITLTADVESYPRINQNSAKAVVINTPLKLDVSTTLGGAGSGMVVISNVISGLWHSLTVNSPATWRVCGLVPNTYSGGTIIQRGTLIWGAAPSGSSPDCSYALGTGPVTLHSEATLQFEKARPTNALSLNGGTLHAHNSAGATWMGPVTVNTNTTVRTDFGMGISGNIKGAGGLTKTGANTLTLSGVNTHTGANVVRAGTLACSTPDSLGAGALSISNGATVNLDYSGTRRILSLTLGGVSQPAGVHGSSNSPATFQDARFSGRGTVTVPVPVSITNLPATEIATNQATLNANLGLNLAYGGTDAAVYAYWGTVSGGTNPAAWANSSFVGRWTNVVSTNIAYTATGLAMDTNTTYYFAFLATNATYAVWATNVLSFTTPTKLAFATVPVYPPAGYPFSVTVQARDAKGNPQTVTSATTVQLSRSSGSGTLSGTLSGTMANGSDSVVISGAAYPAADTMTLTATAVSGMGLGAGVSPPITFMPPDLAWDANGTGAGVTDGGGAWVNAGKTWWNGTTNVNWADHYNARFGAGGAGGTITLDTVTANLVTFSNFSGTYTLAGGTLNVMSNLTVANSAGNVVLAYLIGGPGGVTMNGSGSLRLYGLSPNTYSGGTLINRGTVIWGAMVNGSSPACHSALGTGPVTLNSGATLQFENASPTNALILNGGTFQSQNGWGVRWKGPVTVNSNTTLQANFSMAFSGNISGAGGFTKTGGNTVTFSGANTCAGATVVQAGTLSCSKSASLGSGALSISDGAVVNLNYSGTRRITALKLGGTNMAPGVYGSADSSAAKKDSHFTGTGTVTVLAEPARADDRLSPAAFAEPPVQVRPGCFWAWLNGSITPEQITRDLEAMKQGGMRGGEIWDVAAAADPDGRVPAGPPFLGPESTRLIAHAIREAGRLGLELGLVASSGWNAGGSWIPPRHAGKGLYFSTTTVGGPTAFHEALPLPELPKDCPRDEQGRPIYLLDVAVLAVPNSKSNIIANANHVIDLTTKVGADGRMRWEVPAGDWAILRFVCLNHGQQLIVPSPNSGGPMIDFFDPRATEFHLRHIAGTILKELGRETFAGTSFQTMEFDSMELDGFTPWTDTMADAFQRQAGYPVISFLPLLAGWKLADPQAREQFLYDWKKFVSDRLIESHYATGRKVLQSYGVKLIAEAGGPGPPIWDSNPVDGIKALGVVDIPRGEFWIRHRGIFLVKEIAAAAHVYDKRLVDAESFTTWRRWVDGPLNHKELADRALCEGLNCFSLHTFASSPPEAGLPGWAYHAGTDINPAATWWPMVRGFMDYLARCSYMLRQGWFVADVCYYYGDQAPNFFPPLCNVPDKPLLDGLAPRNDFDVCSSEVILQRMRVENGRILLPDGMSYAALVLPEQDHIPLEVLRKIRALVADGATAFGHQRPARAPGRRGFEQENREVERLVQELWGADQPGGPAVQVRPIGRGRFVIASDRTKALREIGVGPDFEIAGRGGPDLGPLDFVHRKTTDAEFYFIRNKTRESQALTCRFRVAAEANGRTPEFWWPDSGRRGVCHGWKAVAGGHTELPLELGPLGSVFVVFRKGGGAGRELDALARDTFPAAETGASLTLDGPWLVEFPEGWGAPRTASFEKLQSWTESADEGIRFFSGIATYRKSFELPGSLANKDGLFLQLGDLAEIAEVTLNGKRLGLAWLPPYRVDISGAARPGANQLEIRVANLWANRLNADSLLPESRRFTRGNLDRIQTDPTSDSNYGRVPHGNTRPVYKEIPPLMKSGLFGPVRVITPKAVVTVPEHEPGSKPNSPPANSP